MVRKTTSLKIDEDLWKKVKIHCINESVEISEYIEELYFNWKSNKNQYLDREDLKRYLGIKFLKEQTYNIK